MGAFLGWLLSLAFFLALEGPEGIWFKIILWGGIAAFALAIFSPLFPDRRKRQDMQERTDHNRRIRGKRAVYDTYIYVSVYFLNRGNWYYYLTEDPEIRPNDVVVVPWGRNNAPELAIVGWVEHRTADDVPYPLSRMKYIRRRASDSCRPAFDEMIRWPMEVNTSWRWTRDEEGNSLEVINDRIEREKLREWISENPRLKPVERYVPGEKSENEKFREAVLWYNIANGD